MIEIKTVPYVPLSHPFVERLIGTIRRELLDLVPFWNAHDLSRKIDDFKHYYNYARVHSALGGAPPRASSVVSDRSAQLDHYQWQIWCRGLYQLPVAV